MGGVDWAVGARGKRRKRWRKLCFTCAEGASSHGVSKSLWEVDAVTKGDPSLGERSDRDG